MDPPALRELQSLFWDAIATTPGETRASAALLEVISDDDRLTAAERVAIYGEMYWRRLLDVLREDFSRTSRLLGDETFATIARAYLAAHPSRHPSIARVGEAFPDFISSHADVPDHVSDLARLEWARLESFAAADAEPLALAHLTAMPADTWTDLRFTATPCVRVLELRWPVQRLLDGDERPRDAEPTVIRVWRRGHLVFHATADATEAAALARLRQGTTFGAIAVLCSDASEAAALLARWLDDGILAYDDAPRASVAPVE